MTVSGRRRPVTWIALLAALALTLAACASQGSGGNMLANERDQLERGCTARGGILVPSGANTGRASTDYACKINAAPFPG